MEILTHRLPSTEALDAVMAKVSNLAVLPHVVFKILELTDGSSDCSSKELANTISIDPGFTVKMLTHANSAASGLQRRVSTIQEATTFLGIKAIRSMALTIGVYDLFVGKTDAESLRRRGWWRHSLNTGVCAREFAQQFKLAPQEEAYTCGLLHYIGKTLLDKSGLGDYADVEILTDAGLCDTEAEKVVFGVGHIAVSLAAGRLWGLPSNIVFGLDYRDFTPGDENRALRATVALADYVARHIANGRVNAGDEANCPSWALEALGIPSGTIAKVIELGRSAIAVQQQKGN